MQKSPCFNKILKNFNKDISSSMNEYLFLQLVFSHFAFYSTVLASCLVAVRGCLQWSFGTVRWRSLQFLHSFRCAVRPSFTPSLPRLLLQPRCTSNKQTTNDLIDHCYLLRSTKENAYWSWVVASNEGERILMLGCCVQRRRTHTDLGLLRPTKENA